MMSSGDTIEATMEPTQIEAMLLNIEVTEENRPRALRILDTIAMLELEGERMRIKRIESEISRRQWEEWQSIERELKDRQEKEGKHYQELHSNS